MRCLSIQEMEEWLSEVGIRKNDSGFPDLQNLPAFRTFLPEKVFQNQEVGREVVSIFGNWKHLLVWIFDWPMYKQDQMAVVLQLRKSNRESRDLVDAPGHLFSENEKELAAGIVGLCLMYYATPRFEDHLSFLES